MYSSGVALSKSGRHKGDYAITAVIPYRFTAGASRIDDPNTVESFTTAMLASGVVVSGSRVGEIRGNSFSDMARHVMSDRPVGESSELVIVAHSTPDVIPSDVPSIEMLAMQHPSAAAAFTLCDEGPSIAYTAIEIARQFAAKQSYNRVLILVTENSTFPYEPRVTDAEVVLEDAAVLLVLEPSGSAATTLESRHVEPGAGFDSIKATVIEIVRAIHTQDPGPEDPLWVIGFGLLAFASTVQAEVAGQVVVSAIGQPVTSVWSDAVRHTSVTESISSVVIDFDTSAGTLVACHLKIPAADRP